jgi:hypothetical protein
MIAEFLLTSPLNPSPARDIAKSRCLCWLERGIKERGGCAPS